MINQMPRKKRKGQKAIANYYISYGYDIDVKKWFIDIELINFFQSNNIQWFDTKKDFLNNIKNYLDYQ